MLQIAFHNTAIILNDLGMVFLIEKYWLHCFLLHLQASIPTIKHIHQVIKFLLEILNQFILQSAIPEIPFYHTPPNTDYSQSSSVWEVKNSFNFGLTTGIKNNVLSSFKSSLYWTMNLHLTWLQIIFSIYSWISIHGVSWHKNIWNLYVVK